MTALRFTSTARPSMIGAKVLPMSEVDAEFWRLRRERDGIETRRAETRSGSVHESPVGNADAPKGRMERIFGRG